MLFAEDEEVIFKQTFDGYHLTSLVFTTFIKQSVSGFHLDPFAHAFNHEVGKIVYLTAKEFDLLRDLLFHKRAGVYKRTALRQRWGYGSDVKNLTGFKKKKLKLLIHSEFELLL